MIADVLGVLLGFVSVILLLSIIVTAIVQTIIVTFRLRRITLRWMLELLFCRAMDAHSKAATDKARQLARTVIESIPLVPVSDDNRTKEIAPTDGAGVGNPAVKKAAKSISKISLSELLDLIELFPQELWPESQRENEERLTEFKDRIRASFTQFEYWAQVQFKQITTILAVGVAIGIAFYFQVSTPQLLRDLWSDAEFRASAAGLTANAENNARRLATSQASYEDVASQALNELADQYPSTAILLEEIAAVDSEKVDLMREMELVLESLTIEQRTQMLFDYDRILERLRNERIAELQATIRGAQADLASIDILPWRYGWRFYIDDHTPTLIGRWIGVLFTGALLSLGAPFWYERLKQVAALRQVFQASDSVEQRQIEHERKWTKARGGQKGGS